MQQCEYTIADDNDAPIGLCGVVQGGVIWMVDELFSNKKYKIQLIRKGREWVDSSLKSYKTYTLILCRMILLSSG